MSLPKKPTPESPHRGGRRRGGGEDWRGFSPHRVADFKVSIARDAPVPQPNPRNESGAYARVASIAPSSQMLCWRVSGMTKRAIRHMSNGSPMGYASAHPRLFVDR